VSQIVLEQVRKRFGCVKAPGESTVAAPDRRARGIMKHQTDAARLLEPNRAFLLFRRQFMQSFMQAGIK